MVEKSRENRYNTFSRIGYAADVAEIAQLVEHFTRNEGVVGSSPIFSLLAENCSAYLLKIV